MNTNGLPAVAQTAWPAALASRPLLIYEPHALEFREAYLEAERLLAEPQAAAGSYSDDAPRYAVVDDVAVIPINGALISRGDYIGGSYYTSYGAITREVRRATADTSIRAIVTAISSPGGTVEGILGAAGAIREARLAGMPVVAHVRGMAASAGYWLAAQSDEIVLNDDLALVGSIGVYTMHMDVSKLLTDIGINVSLISSGRHKVDGHPFAPLPADVRERIQMEVDDLRLMFAREVAAGRPKLTAELALSTEARVYRALNPRTGDREAITNKLADRVDSLDAVIGKLPRASRRAFSGGLRMENQNGTPAATTPSTTDQIAAAREEGRKAGVSEGIKVGIDTERARISAIIGHAEAEGREQLARTFAFDTDMTVDKVAALLKSAPKADAKPAVPEQRASTSPLGLVAEAVTAPQEQAKSGWSKAVAAANKRFESIAG
ncbi:S49 family peptidase [Rhodoplanes sp. TEM]|uniref:S49 family peptidase n=1 Tax=Rhodoplanes tepidamans TaxID=200616 RepID=A0ABT5J6W6_RHOTP|nr:MULTISPECIES: S49 family peptidase [Rhodoplanes]MDC7784775.1 S49 family peptidase [Rhodoplanes tepidamans]MDC7982242.1 S49 family peptidase [Rhodoplanes sp. TEM]MDQ0356249.1 signal peptide peptidase SppA [Rhodoplanes tepidamans]